MFVSFSELNFLLSGVPLLLRLVTNSTHCSQSSAALFTVRVSGGEAALVCEAVGTLAAAVSEQGASSGAAAIANGDPTGALAVAAAGVDSEIVFNGFF